jgi:hypothetical protein
MEQCNIQVTFLMQALPDSVAVRSPAMLGCHGMQTLLHMHHSTQLAHRPRPAHNISAMLCIKMQ